MGIRAIKDYALRCNCLLQELSKKEGIPLIELWIDSIWSFIRYGCTIRQYHKEFYQYGPLVRNHIFTFRKFKKLVAQTNNPYYISILAKKDAFNSHFSRFISRKWLSSNNMTYEAFDSLCSSETGIIVKPLDGMEGKDVFIIPQDALRLPESHLTYYKQLKCGNWIIEEVVKQHPEMVFGSNSVNTIRAISLMDKRTKEVAIVKTVVRVGVGESYVDNFHQGGCVYDVDIDTGLICSKGISSELTNIIIHPGTSICMLGYKLPKWEEVKTAIYEAHQLIPQCRYISWDVAITEKGVELIEGNHDGDYDMLEFVGRGMMWPILKQYL